MTKDKLALFDLDGTLFNTDDVNYTAYRDAFADFGVELDRDYFVKECNGRHYKEFVPRIMGGTEHMEEIHEKKKANYAGNLKYARRNEHLFNIIEGLRKDYHLAVVTTASKKNVTDILNFFGVQDLFDLIVTQEDITRPKPDPEGFLKAMDHFGINPKNTVIFEDADVGIEAAKRSGAVVFKVEKF